jgi:hypothetical protein
MANEKMDERDIVLPFVSLTEEERKAAVEEAKALPNDDATWETLKEELNVSYCNFKTASDETFRSLSEKKEQMGKKEFNDYLRENFEERGGQCVKTIKSHLDAWESNGQKKPERLTRPLEDKLEFVGAHKVGNQIHIDIYHVGWEVTIPIAVDIPA